MSTLFPVVSWANSANIYEVNIRQYTKEGTFQAFQKHLPRLKSMGVAILWLMPVTPISKLKRKGSLGSYYACSSYIEINPEYGNKQDFKNLIDEAHKLGFKLIIDWVANHTGWDHEWTVNPDWYVHDKDGNFTEVHGWDDVIDLNYSSQPMRDAMIKAMRFWVGDFNIDGFRCDMAHLVPLDFWHEARKSCEQIKPLFWLGECDEPGYSEVFDFTYSWTWMHATEKYAKDSSQWGLVKSSIDQYLTLPKGGYKLYFTSNHDENSWNGTEYEKYGMPLAKNLAILTSLLPGLPLIYGGQELPVLKRLLFFDKDEINWASHPYPELASFYQTLLTLRKTHHATHLDAKFSWLPIDPGLPILAFFLQKGADKIIAIWNFSTSQPIRFSVTIQGMKNKYQQLFSGITHQLEDTEQFELLANDCLVYSSI